MGIRGWVGAAIGGLLGAAVGIFFVLPLGLVVSEYVVFPLAMWVGGVLAVVGAGWMGNWLAEDGSRTELLRVAWVTLGVGAGLAVVVLLNAALRVVLLGPVFYLGVFCVVGLAGVATVGTWRFRRRGRGKERGRYGDGVVTVWLVVGAVVSVPVVVTVAWALGLAGA